MTARPPIIDLMRCSGCLACIKNCPNQALDEDWLKGLFRILFNPGRCLFCGRCGQVCPEEAIDFAQAGIAPAVKATVVELIRLEALTCAGCGRPFLVPLQQRKLEARLNTPKRKLAGRRNLLCARCRQETAAQKRRLSLSGEVRS
jgi:Pyruvate/2-oxoacid:ferredoxin oxidoreductase delta subunit